MKQKVQQKNVETKKFLWRKLLTKNFIDSILNTIEILNTIKTKSTSTTESTYQSTELIWPFDLSTFNWSINKKMCSNVLLFIITSINCFVVQLNSETIEYHNPIILKDEFDLNDHIYGINHQQLELNRVKTIDYQTSIDHHVVAKPHVFTHDINPHKLNYQVLQPAQASGKLITNYFNCNY